MITLTDVRKVFHSGQPSEYVAVNGVSLEVAANQLTVLKGPSGSGKTTLLSLIGCMARPTSGRIFLGEREITSLPERFLTDIRRRTFGFIFQQYNLLSGLSLLENVLMPAYPLGESLSTLKRRGLALLDRFGLSHRAAAQVEWLSGGESQRVAMARALMNDPQVIIADEPTAHLDTKLSREFMEMMRQSKAEGKTILMASHDPLVYEAATVDRVINLRDGSIVEPGA
jgi:putative ABC transport system ATP-binding protein